ncbi:imidazole glycerol phosphate synthase subunit HisH [Cobetia marina]|jgi:glutamine amidotransferase|uniref:Imidazole glycerol phosphate synthase subunit HisH n=1 Tax=Cobetia marina TaxID=28258 RepID=A0ABU9GFT6_COBMA|nr:MULTISPECIES: imidazole glycerol phosphate synthase subunit HisH [Cobetia]AOM02516.1 imidazole glycerol phosphate synthase, glutamine amidotransferase subunit [Cobetia marina]AZV32314.1 imidazole glycerol phosphate synthase subunit HisH [Cobetia sp. ICG0124]MBE2168967.1 imidazole glycerol phosphate synthase subunit HisH [Cobetia sp. 2AS1]MDA5565451.1 imidazole glycerol phosphate synthase subunit HisH [Cobetia sp. MMG027]MDH2291908.1 imidazole glycerol phosphate synthase subunit HisH [Cobeti
MTIAVIDYGMGNLHSVAKALEHVADENVVITSDPRAIRGATRVVLPGQGAIRDCMGELERAELRGLVGELLSNHSKPLLGVCVGQQMLMERSEENGGIDCLAYFKGDVKRFDDKQLDEHGQRLKVPHMGWNHVAHTQGHALWEGIEDNSRFYFVHSFYVSAAERSQVFGATHYAGAEAHVAIGEGSLFAVQFHPEKSAAAGLKLLENFVRWQP